MMRIGLLRPPVLSLAACRSRQQRLYLVALPHGHGSLREAIPRQATAAARRNTVHRSEGRTNAGIAKRLWLTERAGASDPDEAQSAGQC